MIAFDNKPSIVQSFQRFLLILPFTLGDNEEEYSYEDDGYEYADDIGSEPNIFTVPQTAYLKINENIELPCEGENLGNVKND